MLKTSIYDASRQKGSRPWPPMTRLSGRARKQMILLVLGIVPRVNNRQTVKLINVRRRCRRYGGQSGGCA